MPRCSWCGGTTVKGSGSGYSDVKWKVELFMYSKFKAIIFTLAALLIFTTAACTVSAQTLNSPEALKEYLDKQPANTPDRPIRVSYGS